MSVGVIPLPVRSAWQWRDLIMFVLLCLALLLSLTLVTVLSIGLKRDCHVEQEYLTTENGIYLTDEMGRFLVTDREVRQCQIIWQPLFE